MTIGAKEENKVGRGIGNWMKLQSKDGELAKASLGRWYLSKQWKEVKKYLGNKFSRTREPEEQRL